MYEGKTWILMGHSTLHSPVTRKVPKGVTLVLMAKCGRQFVANNNFREAFKSNNLINEYLELNTNKNVYTSGNKYTNQFVQLEIGNNLPHGLCKLPMNIRAANYRLSNIKGRPKISNALKTVKNPGGGVLIGMFCRGTPGPTFTRRQIGEKRITAKLSPRSRVISETLTRERAKHNTFNELFVF